MVGSQDGKKVQNRREDVRHEKNDPRERTEIDESRERGSPTASGATRGHISISILTQPTAAYFTFILEYQ